MTVSTYTAQLTAVRTRPEFEFEGPQDMSGLREASACFPHYVASWAAMVSPFVKNVVFPDDADMTPEGRSRWCRQKLEDGDVDVIVVDEGTGHPFHLEHCRSIYKPPRLRFAPTNIVGILSQADADFGYALTVAANHLLSTYAYSSILINTLDKGRECVVGEDANKLKPITVEQLGGAFLVFLVGAGVALVATCLQERLKRSPEVRQDDKGPARAAADADGVVAANTAELAGLLRESIALMTAAAPTKV